MADEGAPIQVEGARVGTSVCAVVGRPTLPSGSKREKRGSHPLHGGRVLVSDCAVTTERPETDWRNAMWVLLVPIPFADLGTEDGK